ncbi:hypothetical protein SLEP1_g52276 [Rubroshorea leprosula]|uniref:Integrase catalytic domain-containing protein n=1 Tax=Rubroshorea leprosula TaxID=152421 RepID=A0AAV5M5Y7_9ROSI|nr:hypothetical protein SLEP1_g52276 [Rubroshorea leprosula]
MTDEEWTFEHQQSCGYIRQWVKDNVLNHIANKTHAGTLLKKLKTLYASKTGNNKLFQLKRLINLKCKEGSPISNHVSWTIVAPNGVMTMEYAKTGVLNEERRSKNKGQGGRDKSRSKSRPKYKDLERHHCGKKGHIKKCCFQLKREMRQEKKKDGDNENRVAAAIDGDLLFAGDENVINFASHETRKLDDDGYCSSFNDGQWKLTKGSLVVAQGSKSSNLYLTQGSISSGFVNVVGKDESLELWHKRVSHMSAKGIDCLVKKDVLSGLKESKLEKCVHCLVSSHGGALYFVTFIDDHSRKLWVYPLKTKDQVLDVFKQFQALVERQTGKKLKCICIDNGGEYSGPFDNYCMEQGIKHQKSPPKTPQLNGLVERMNRTLMERVRCLLAEAKLPRAFWAEALNIVAHVINLSPTIALDNDVLDRVWYGKDVSYDHLQVFGVQDAHVDANDLDAPFNEAVNDQQDVPIEVPVDPLRRPSRERRPSSRYPSTMKDEMKSLLDNHTFDLVNLPKDRKALKNWWVYRVKHEDGTLVPRYKARLVVKGFSQKKGVDFNEIFSPVVKMSSIRVVLGLVACLDLEVEQMDVKNAFLHGDLDEEIYMEQREDFKAKDKEDFVCRLKKRLYGLKQAPKQWIKKLKQELNKSFAMKDLGPVKQILGMMINCDRVSRKLWLSQDKYIERVLQRFQMDKARVANTPLAIHFRLSKGQCLSNDEEKDDMQRVPYASTVGSLMYAIG